ncbi:MAG: hypothetical protein JWN44_3271 [Myxococcales bacterium]|nr:hypothetical protein [Myxococcales bacterium]
MTNDKNLPQMDEQDENLNAEDKLTADDLGAAVIRSNAEAALRPVRHIRREQ